MGENHSRQPDTGARRRKPLSPARGVDGLTEAELRRGRAEWWDDAFTALLLDAVPDTSAQLVEIGCGLGHAAHALLPALPGSEYTGIDIDAERVETCRQSLAIWGDRARVVQGTAEALPLDAASTDVLLSVMTLQHLTDVPAALTEARRVLRPGGRLIAVEPDNLSQQLRFDGCLPGLDEAFVDLFRKLIELRRPADLALGPRLPALLRAAGFDEVHVRVHTVQSVHEESADAFFARLDTVVDTIAASGGLHDDEPALVTCRGLLATLRADLAGKVGFSAHSVPVWRCVGAP